jgi:hypothetical protein
MTVATLLAHVGIDVPRYVTVDGQIVLDRSAATMASPLRIAPHRFHDGHDPAPVRKKFDAAWWNTDPEARAADENAMHIHFPNFSLYGSEEEDYLWGGRINTGRGSFSILVLPQVNHSLPSVAPKMKNLGRPEGRRLRRPPHLYDSGALCVASVSDWDPTKHSTATAVAWAAHWFAAYTEWRMRGYWPTDGYGAVAS